jgi:phosphate starvation-inducible protein PhoH and related proteins
MSKKEPKIRTNERYIFTNESLYQKVCGINDSRLKDLENFLKVEIIPRGNTFLLNGLDESVVYAIQFFKRLEDNYASRPDQDDFDIFDINYLVRSKDSESKPWNPSEKILTNFKGKPIYPKTVNQEKFVSSLMNNLISIALGPAGTGKTFLSIATACRMLQTGEVEKLILTRPAVEAGESLGFLPGDLVQKVDPYLRPIYDSLNDCLGTERVQFNISTGKIEIAPMAFMRGRTLSNAFIILDEAQNCTVAQLKMFLTRLGKNSRMAISGDVTQIDLPTGKSGLQKILKALENINQIGIVELNKEDITRHPLIEIIVQRLEGL